MSELKSKLLFQEVGQEREGGRDKEGTRGGRGSRKAFLDGGDLRILAR